MIREIGVRLGSDEANWISDNRDDTTEWLENLIGGDCDCEYSE